MSVLILKNISSEGPGTIEDFLRQKGTSYKVVDCGTEEIPGASGFDVLVMMGGPMSVNDEDKYPYLIKEGALVREFISGGKKVFGICLGSQIMAKALGARVYVGPEKEIGWFDIELTEEGAADLNVKRLASYPGAGDLRKRFKVFHWHGETFDIPGGAVRLAKSDIYPNQAFKYGDRAYAFQFHIEVTREMIYEWLRNEHVDMDLVMRMTDSVYGEYHTRAMNFYEAFFSLQL